MLNTILAAISAVAAAVAAVCAVLALRKASDTINVARRAQEDAAQAAKDAAADRREAERERDRHRIEHVGEIVEAIASASRDHLDGRVVVHRNRLRHALVGLHERLPVCVKLLDEVKSPDQVDRYVSNARTEVEYVLEHLNGGLAQA
jgi:hypothetical protein